ncbi:MAG TPA: hypothetical protein ENI72_00095 [Rhodospirillales bacterium]|nr:hypothetical protein [Rhodospirillales bacterium]
MKIERGQELISNNPANTLTGREPPSVSFASMLESERLKAENITARTGILANQKSKKENPNKEDIDFIREHGVRAYAEEIQQRKKEELREKLLKKMGLTEEDLANMSSDQRMVIEEMIAREIRQRLAAESLDNQGSEDGSPKGNQAGVGDIGFTKQMPAQVLVGSPGSFVALTINEMTDPSRAIDDRKKE